MKVRYVIELDIQPDRVNLALVDRDGEYVGGTGSNYASIDEAKAVVLREEPDISWKDAPRDWQPDTILVTSYFEDEGWDTTRG